MPEEAEWSIIFDSYPSHLRFYKGRGCEACGFTGYKGRTLISEIFEINKEIAAALTKGAEVDDLKLLAQANGMKTLLDDALLKLEETTLNEILRMVPHDMIQMFRTRQRHGGFPGKAIDPGQGGKVYKLTDPEKDGVVLERLSKDFISMKKDLGQGGNGQESPLFREFIAESYRDIRSRYHCDEVEFHLEAHDGKVEISALPVAQ